jgi:hypothetical protein
MAVEGSVLKFELRLHGAPTAISATGPETSRNECGHRRTQILSHETFVPESDKSPTDQHCQHDRIDWCGRRCRIERTVRTDFQHRD